MYNLNKFPYFSNIGSSFIPLNVKTSKLCAKIIKVLYSDGESFKIYSSKGFLSPGSISFLHFSKIGYDETAYVILS